MSIVQRAPALRSQFGEDKPPVKAWVSALEFVTSATLSWAAALRAVKFNEVAVLGPPHSFLDWAGFGVCIFLNLTAVVFAFNAQRALRELIKTKP